MAYQEELPPLVAGEKIKVRKAYVDKYPTEFKTNTWYEVMGVSAQGVDVAAEDTTGTSWVTNENIIRNTMLLKKKEAAEAEVVEEVKEPVPTKKIGKDEVIGQKKNKEAIKLAIEHDLPVLLIGETGTGKTSLVREQAIENKKELVRFSITGETTVDEFVGKYELEAGKTVWKDGVLLDAMKNGKWLVADEINVALPEILFVLHSLLDDDKYVTVSQHLGEVVKPHEDFRFFGTMNPPEEYAGTKELNKAFQSRFSIVLEVNYPAKEIEVKIVSSKADVPSADATRMVDVANALRKAKKDEKIFFTCSTRDLLHWGELINKGMSPNDAFVISVLNKTGTDKDVVREIYQKILGEYIKLDEPGIELSIDWFKSQKEAIKRERAEFEARKTEIREEITKEIVTKLTSPTVEVEAPEVTDGIFKS